MVHIRINSAILLTDPKFGENVGGAIRACAAFEVPVLRWTGCRVPLSKRVLRYGRVQSPEGDRAVDYAPDPEAFDRLTAIGLAPVAVELWSDAVPLPRFEHPANGLYVFGPEDGSLPKRMRNACVARVFIPSQRCLNLAAAVNVVLYDRCAKLGAERDSAGAWVANVADASRRGQG